VKISGNYIKSRNSYDRTLNSTNVPLAVTTRDWQVILITRPVRASALYTTVMRQCTGRVHVYMAVTQPCTSRVHGRYTAVHGRNRVCGHVHGCVGYTYGVHGRVRCTQPCTRPCTDRV